MKLISRFAFLLLFLLPFKLMAGWLITGRIIDQEGNTILKRYFIENNQVKVERYNLIYSVNLKTGSIILVDPENLVFVRTSLKAYTDKIREIKMKHLIELLKVIPADQKVESEKLLKAQLENDLVLNSYKGDSLTLTKMPETVELLDLVTEKFRVEESGKLREEFFFSKEVNLSADFNLGVFLQYVHLLEPEDNTVNYRFSKLYMDKVEKGLVIRRFMTSPEGFRTEWQVNNYEKKTIPAYEFGAPAMCKELTLDKWLARTKQPDDKYYDDYE